MGWDLCGCVCFCVDVHAIYVCEYVKREVMDVGVKKDRLVSENVYIWACVCVCLCVCVMLAV